MRSQQRIIDFSLEFSIIFQKKLYSDKIRYYMVWYDMIYMKDTIVIRLIHVWETNEIKNFYLKIK